MIYGYIRVSSDKQTTENQKFEITNYSKAKELPIGEWIEETISATKKLSERKFGGLLDKMQKGDILYGKNPNVFFHTSVQNAAFGLSAEIERNLISQRTKEALARKRAEGVILGRPKGSKSKVRKLTGKEAEIKTLLDKKVSKSAIARILGVHRLTVAEFVKESIRFCATNRC
jgi:DNA invertase Pin-like site-specific DNA recombinase